jgi:hypothetical protein
MSICMIFEGKGVTEAQYDTVSSEVIPGAKLPAGMLYHVAGQTPDGFRVVEVWESQAAAETFFKEKLGPSLEKHKVNAVPTTFQVHKILKP